MLVEKCRILSTAYMDDLTLCHSLAAQRAAIWRKAWKLLLQFGSVSGLTIPLHRCRLLVLPRQQAGAEVTQGLSVRHGGGQAEITASPTQWRTRGASIRTCARIARLLPLADTGDASIQYDSTASGLHTICDLPLTELRSLLSKPPARLRQALHCGFQGECRCKGKVAIVTWRPLTPPQWWTLEASPFGAGPYQKMAMHLGFPVAGTGHQHSERSKAWVKPMVTFTARTTAAKRTRIFYRSGRIPH